jgi:sugar phosphate isomerase/epimerase
MFPFKLATTSYIYPDHILPNVAMLSPFVDEIELVLFESEGQNNLLDEGEIRDLKSYSVHHGVGFNVHLPIDLFLGDRSQEVRTREISVIKKIIKQTLCLNPSVYTLHLELGDRNGQEETDVEIWRRHTIQSVEELSQAGIEPGRISIETLGYPFEWIEDIVKDFGFSICLDIGHILTYEQDLQGYLEKYLVRTSIVHFHGSQNGIDHLGIDRLPKSALETILSHLSNYHGIVSMEVFSIDDLKRSLITLEEVWRKG